MKMLIYVGDMITDLPGIKLGELIARQLDAEVILLHIAPKDLEKKRGKEKGKEILNQAADLFEGLSVKTLVRRGDVTKRILAEVEEERHDMVVITASRIGGPPRILSVKREILPKMPCCVVLAKSPKPEVNKILMLTGGLRVSESMINIGARLASALSAKVTLMHVTPNVPTMYTGLEHIEETLEEMLQTDTPVAKHLRACARLLAKCDVPSELKLKHGEPVYEIVREVDRGDYDFLIIGASGASSSLKEMFFRNVTKDVMEMVAIPIMVVNQRHAKKMKDNTY
jgi:nucleotide-binding universal stress UspA family protein